MEQKMDFIERVPCSDGTSHTSFGILVSEAGENELEVSYFPSDNFRLVDTAWRQKFTDLLAEKLHKDHPDKSVTFRIN